MGTIVTATQLDAVIKELYPAGLPTEIMMRGHAFMSKVPKDTNAYGEYVVVPVVTDNPPGRTATIATLLGANGPIGETRTKKFNVTLFSDYAATWLDSLTLMKMSTDRGAFVEARKFEIDGLIRQLGNSLGHALYRSGTGSIAQIVAGETLTDANFTVRTKSDAKFFSVGMQISFSATDGGTLRDSGDFVSVISVDYDSGLITTDSADLTASITGITANDFVLPRGDFNLKLAGLAGWIPLVTPTSTPFFGLDRTSNPVMLAGTRLDQVTVAAEDTIMQLADLLAERGGNPDISFCSPRQFTKIVQRLNAKVEYDDGGGTANYGFSTIRIFTAAGPIQVYPDPDCPDNRVYVLEMDTWRLKHLGDLPHIVVDDGNRALRLSTADAIEVRVRQYPTLCCYAPGHNAVGSCQL